MGKWSVILGVAVLALSATLVRADMAGASYRDVGTPVRNVVVQIETDEQLTEHQTDASQPVSLGSLGMMLPGDLSDDSDDGEQQSSNVRVLPSGPSSVALFFSALSGLGFWQLGRSARKFNFASVPDWYHAGGPMQVGHVTAINPDLTAPATISLCDLLAEQSTRFLWRRVTPLRLKPQCSTSALAAPRAPPRLSL